MEKSIMINTPEGIEMYRILAIKGALALEIKTGLKFSRGSILAKVNREFGTKFRHKQQALEFIENLITERYGSCQ